MATDRLRPNDQAESYLYFFLACLALEYLDAWWSSADLVTTSHISGWPEHIDACLPQPFRNSPVRIRVLSTIESLVEGALGEDFAYLWNQARLKRENSLRELEKLFYRCLAVRLGARGGKASQTMSMQWETATCFAVPPVPVHKASEGPGLLNEFEGLAASLEGEERTMGLLR